MNLKYYMIAMVFLISFSSSNAQSPAPKNLDLDQAIRLVLENHPAIKQAQQYVAASGGLVAQKRSAYYPEIKAHGTYSRIGPVPSLEVPGRGEIDFYPHDNYDFHVALKQTVLDFGRRPAKVELARSFEESARENVAYMKSNLVYRTIGNFYLILLLGKNIEVVDEELEALNQHLAVAEKKVETGTGIDFDVLTTRVKVAEATNMKIDIENELEKQTTAFRELLGLSQEDSIEVVGEFTLREIKINPDSLIELALERLPEARLSRQAETSADIQYGLDAKGDRPTLDMVLDFGFKNGYTPDLNKLEANWIAGVRLEVPVFNGFLTRHKKSASYASLLAAREYSSSVERQVKADVKQAIADFEAAEEKVKTSEVQVEYAEAALSIARSRYNIGVITNLDLLDAQTSVARAKLMYLKAQYGAVSSGYELNKATGETSWR